MKKFFKSLFFKVSAVSTFLFAFANVVKAYATESIDTIASSTGGILSDTVQAIISVAIEFLTNNLPLIVVLSVAVGMVFWLIRKATRAIRGR